MLPGMEMLACQDLAVPAQVMQHIVEVESGNNPFAIGVVGGQLVRQPANLGEAVATARMLEQKGYNYSVGVAQVNRSNLGKFGLDPVEKAFEVCPNLVAGSKILAQCYASAGGNWGKSFSCYYSGNFTTGFQDGYVRKVFDAFGQQAPEVTGDAIPLQVINGPALAKLNGKGTKTVDPDTAAYRVALRSVVDAAASATLVAPIGRAMAINAPPAAAAPANAANAADAMDAALAGMVASATTTAGSFVPQVSSPGAAPMPNPGDPPTTAQQPVAQNTAQSIPVAPMGDQADLRQGARDDAFVF